VGLCCSARGSKLRVRGAGGAVMIYSMLLWERLQAQVWSAWVVRATADGSVGWGM
jgi:hypothetical protein